MQKMKLTPKKQTLVQFAVAAFGAAILTLPPPSSAKSLLLTLFYFLVNAFWVFSLLQTASATIPYSWFWALAGIALAAATPWFPSYSAVVTTQSGVPTEVIVGAIFMILIILVVLKRGLDDPQATGE
jgi:hypothetical protein